MLQKDLNLRISAEEALNSDWFYPLSKISLQLNPTNTEALTNLTKFHQVNYNQKNSNIRQLLLKYLSEQVKEIHNAQEISSLFKILDKNRDGKLSKDEIIDAMNALGLGFDIENIMEKIDFNADGFIEYSEFAIATQNWTQLLECEEIIKNLNEGSETITLNDLKKKLPMIGSLEWAEFLKEIDRNKDGVISLNELQKYLLND